MRATLGLTFAFIAVAVAVVVTVVIVAVTGGSTGDQGIELTSSRDGYDAPVWVGETLYYLDISADSDTSPTLSRIRPGGRPEAVGFAPSKCPAPEERLQWPEDLIPLGEHTLGMLMSCSNGKPTLLRIDEGGPFENPALEPGAGFVEQACGIKALAVPEADCFGGPGARYPVTEPGGDTYYFAPRCGTEDPSPAGTFAVCRYHGEGYPPTTAGRGVRKTMGLDARAGRIVVAGTVDGGDPGLWLLEADRFTRLATGDYWDAGIAPEGDRVASQLITKDWAGDTKYSLRVVTIPDR